MKTVKVLCVVVLALILWGSAYASEPPVGQLGNNLNEPLASTEAYLFATAYGGEPAEEWPYYGEPTSDGGYIVTGKATSFGAGKEDAWVLKLLKNGAVSWQKSFGTSNWDWAECIRQTSDGGYIVAGVTAPTGAMSEDFWVFKLDAKGAVVWENRYGRPDMIEYAHFVTQTRDGGYIVAGEGPPAAGGANTLMVLKLTGTGDIEWQKAYGEGPGKVAYSIQQTEDGGYIVAGQMLSPGSGYVYTELWVLKLTTEGNVDWQKRFGGDYAEFAKSIQQTSDGGYIVAGHTTNWGAGNSDVWIIKLNTAGEIDWQKAYGGPANDYAESVQQTHDGGYVVSGVTDSFGAGAGDGWLLKLNAAGAVLWEKTYGDGGYNFAKSVQQTSDGGYFVTAWLSSKGWGDFWPLRLDSYGNIPDCDYIRTSKATVTDTNATVTVTTERVSDLGLRPEKTAAVVMDTSAVSQTLCSGHSYDKDNIIVDLCSIADLNANAADELVVLKEARSNNAAHIQIKDSRTGKHVTGFDCLGVGYLPKALVAVRDFSGNGVQEIAVLGIQAVNRKVRVQVLDALTGTPLSDIYFTKSYAPKTLIAVEDLTGNGVQEIGVLGTSLLTGRTIVELRDALTGALYKRIPF